MSRPHVLSLSRVRFTIIDEADEMLHDDWEEEMGKIMGGGDTNEDADHRYLLFSATFDKDMRKLAKKYLAVDHVRIRIGRAGSVHMNVKQNVSTTNPYPTPHLTHHRSSGSRVMPSSRLFTIS